MIRDFTPEDYPHFLTLARTFYDTEAVLHRVPEQNFRFTFDQIMAGSPYMRGLMLVCEDGPVGYGLLSFTQTNEAGGLVVWLEEIFILPDYRGRGLAGAYARFIRDAYQGKAARFRLEVSPQNLDIAQWYEQLGFERMDYVQMVKEGE